MIEKVTLKYFKQFKQQSFELEDSVVLAGPNNAGKTTLLQAIATWYFAFNEWQRRKSASSASQRSAVPLTRQQFLSVPVRRFNLLWTDTSTALRKDEGGGRGAANPRIMEIVLEGGGDTGTPWCHSMEFRHANSELIYAKPGNSRVPPEEIRVVYVPSFSGIETEEKVHTREYQEWLVGQGKPGDIIRNLLVETAGDSRAWQALQTDVEKIFGYRLLPPQHQGRPFILCEYLPGIPKGRGHGGYSKLDIASAGSGFLQTLLLLAFFYARPSTVMLIDEPDAHLHFILQKQIYDHLRTVARNSRCQVIVATHSEVIIDNTLPDKIISFYRSPHRLLDSTERDRVREALKRVSSMDILQAEGAKTVLYVEGGSDRDMLQAWADRLGKGKAFSDCFCYPVKGRRPREARDHFFALRAVNPQMTGILLLDGDNRASDAHALATAGLEIRVWGRYEIENYLVHPAAIRRFIEQAHSPISAEAATEKMKDMLPPAVLRSPLADHDYLRTTAASKHLLPQVFSAAGMDIPKQEYYRLAKVMEKEEIHPEVVQILDEIVGGER